MSINDIIKYRKNIIKGDKSMTSHRQLQFNSNVGNEKLDNYFLQNSKCPFCDRSNLANIIDEDDNIILLENKFPVLHDTYQTVLIETDDCFADISTYPKQHLYRLFQFAVRKWLAMESSGKYSSVLFFKNHGPYSGGTIGHPHMQLVGLKHLDYQNYLLPEYFEGITINEKHGVVFNISTKPRVGFFEFNVILPELSHLDQMADYIQTAVHYVLHYFNKSCNSYNLFFYLRDDKIIAKIVPRFITSPLFIGYSIPQVSDRSEQVAAEIQRRYFTIR